MESTEKDSTVFGHSVRTMNTNRRSATSVAGRKSYRTLDVPSGPRLSPEIFVTDHSSHAEDKDGKNVADAEKFGLRLKRGKRPEPELNSPMSEDNERRLKNSVGDSSERSQIESVLRPARAGDKRRRESDGRGKSWDVSENEEESKDLPKLKIRKVRVGSVSSASSDDGREMKGSDHVSRELIHMKEKAAVQVLSPDNIRYYQETKSLEDDNSTFIREEAALVVPSVTGFAQATGKSSYCKDVGCGITTCMYAFEDSTLDRCVWYHREDLIGLLEHLQKSERSTMIIRNKDRFYLHTRSRGYGEITVREPPSL